MKSKILKVCWWILGAIYFPIFFILIALRFVLRLLTALTCYGTFDYLRGNIIIKSLFNPDYERPL